MQVWQITAGYTAEAPPPPVVPTLGFKERRKPASKRTVRWDLKPFKNSGRTDNLELLHWVKVRTQKSAWVCTKLWLLAPLYRS